MNSSKFGFTLQVYIANYYGLVVSDRILMMCDQDFLLNHKEALESYRALIFADVPSKPVKLTTFDLQPGSSTNKVPYNFLLENGQTLSVRSSSTSKKVSPRVVGQAGYKTLTDYFSDVFGREITNQGDIRELFCNHISEILPVYIDNVFSQDYLAFVDTKQNSVLVFDGDNYPDLDFSPSNFSFTRSASSWAWSNTLKYKGLELAEIQVPRGRTLIFRFYIQTLIGLLEQKKKNNESLGMTAEETVCKLFGIDDKGIKGRSLTSLESKLRPVLQQAFRMLPKPIEYTGANTGERGGESKCSYDFILDGGYKLSLKTNIGKMVCPPEVGQPCAKTFSGYFKDLLDGKTVDHERFKLLAYNQTNVLIKRYLSHLFDSDYLLRIFEKDGTFVSEIINKNFGVNMPFDQNLFSFSKRTPEVWKESNTLYYRGMKLGEFQVHQHRDSYKFRFDFENLLSLINEYFDGSKQR